ncbi:MAG TPA: hypothetical protein VK470_08080 [Bacteroidota bacterium]|nr:hypothetical protein [Bacteroidota bacterium]
MKGSTAGMALVVISVALVVLLILRILTSILTSILFVLALLTLGLASRGFGRRRKE